MERLAMVGHDKLLSSLVNVAPSTGTNGISQMFAPALPARSLPATLVCRGIGRLLR
jgi:hypothetical protein